MLITDFRSPLGIIRSYFKLHPHTGVRARGPFSITTPGHHLSLETFKVQPEWLPDGYSVEKSKGWRWIVTKTTDVQEDLRVYCKLKFPEGEPSWRADGGEYLSAMEIESETHHLHIGTENGAMLQMRATNNDLMPERFKDQYNSTRSFIEYIDFGFQAKIPELYPEERIYFHFIAASNEIRASKAFPDERDASTWHAVDQRKGFLDKWLKQ